MKDVIITIVGVIAACLLVALLLGLGSNSGGGLLDAIRNLFSAQVTMLGD